MKVGFLGLGRMGLPMVTRLREAAFDVTAYDVNEAARERARGTGASVVDEIAGMAEADLVMSSLPDTPDVASAYAAPGGVFEVVARGTVCADLSTCSVSGSRSIAETADSRGITFLDTPVSGTSIHAEAGTLVIMAGGDAAGLERARPALDAFSSAVHHVGDNGNGLALKLITNRLLTSHLAAIGEAAIDMEAMGLDVHEGLNIISQGAVAKLLEYKAKPVADRDYTPLFTVDLMRKDLGLAADVLPAARLSAMSRSLLEEAANRGMGDRDIVAMMNVLDDGADAAAPT